MSQLGDLIRRGAQRYPKQAFYDYCDLDDGGISAVCALGAAVVAYFHANEEVLDPDAIDWPGECNDMLSALSVDAAPETRPSCPVANCESQERRSLLITHLNDDHRWSREQIADWLDSR